MPEGLQGLQPPIIRHPEVEAQKDKYAEALEAERLAYEFKVKQEEMLTIFDEIKQYMTYENVANFLSASDEEIPEEVKSQILKSFEKIKEDREEASTNVDIPLFYKDFTALLGSSIDAFSDCLYQSIERDEIEKSSAIVAEQDKRNDENGIFYRTVGKFHRYNVLIDTRFVPLQSDIASFTEAELLKIKTYGLASLPDVRTALKNNEDIKTGIKVKKESKTWEATRSTKEVATIYGVDKETVSKTEDRSARIIKKNTGLDFAFSTEEKHDELIDVVDKEFIAAYVNYLHDMKNMYRMLNEGRIVETKYIQDIMDEAMASLTKNPPKIVYFHGDFGTGKTALAVHIAKTKFHKKPIIVSGSKFLEPDRFTEEFQIRKLAPPEFFNQLYAQLHLEKRVTKETPTAEIFADLGATQVEMQRQALKNLEEDFPGGVSPELISKIDKQLDNLFSNSVQGQYVLGAMYEAMSTGTPLIIDEANAISPEVMIALNDLLTKKYGDAVSTRTAQGEITVKKGFCVMWTGNTGDRYKKARYQDIDPASLSRITPINVRYLPNNLAVQNFDSLFKRLDLENINDTISSDEGEMLLKVKDSREKAIQDQIFQVLLVKSMESRLGAELLVKTDDPNSYIKDLYRLSAGARTIMHLFEGEYDATNMPEFSGIANIIGDTTPTTIMTKMQKSNLTMRELIDDIVGGYQDEGGAMDIEYYLFNFVKKYNNYPEEQAILYHVLNGVGFFEKSEGWPDHTACANVKEFKDKMEFNPVDGVDKYKKIRKNGEYAALLNTDSKYHLQYVNSLQMLQTLFGYLPARKPVEYDKVLQKSKEAEPKQEMSTRQKEILTSAKEIKDSISINLFQTSDQADGLLTKMKSYKFANPEESQTLNDDEFMEEADGFCNTMLQFLLEIGKINQETYDQTQTGSIETKMDLIKQTLAKQ